MKPLGGCGGNEPVWRPSSTETDSTPHRHQRCANDVTSWPKRINAMDERKAAA
jgi:hypothetical protein